MDSKRLNTAKKFIDYFTTLDVQVLHSILSEDYTHQFAPASVNIPGPLRKKEFLEHQVHLHEIISTFPVTTTEYIDSDSSNRVIIWATGQAIFRDDVKDEGISPTDWEYKGEYIFMFTFDGSGKKIIQTLEFLDSKATVDNLMVLMKRAKENRTKRLAGVDA